MACEFCTDPDGEPCYPQYGVAPHRHTGMDGTPLMGQTVVLPKSEWPSNFQEREPGFGIWWCPDCGHGKPDEVGHNT